MGGISQQKGHQKAITIKIRCLTNQHTHTSMHTHARKHTKSANGAHPQREKERGRGKEMPEKQMEEMSERERDSIKELV